MKGKMKATILHGPNDLRLEEVDIPEIGPNEVLVKVIVDGVCPSGVHAVKRGIKWGPPDALFPGFPGHEFSGIVIEVGERVSHLKEGDRVVADLIIPCGKCRLCRSGRDNLCPNIGKLGYFSWAEYIKTPGNQTYKFSDSITFEEAAFTEPLSTVLHSVKRANIPYGGNVVIIGSGPMGLLHLQLTKRLFGAYVIMVDLREDRLRIAEHFGADAVFVPDEKLPQEIERLTDGQKADTVIVTAGSTIAQESALNLVARGGTIILFAGIHLIEKPSIQLDPNFVHYGEVDIRGSSDKTRDEFFRALKLIEHKAVDVKSLITHKFSLEEYKKALEVFDKKEGLKIMIYPSK